MLHDTYYQNSYDADALYSEIKNLIAVCEEQMEESVTTDLVIMKSSAVVLKTMLEKINDCR